MATWKGCRRVSRSATIEGDFDDLLAALAAELEKLSPGAGARAAFELPKQTAHGDWATNAAMQLAKPLKQNPRALGEQLKAALEVMLECAERTGATAVSCNGLDTSTGRFSGTGPTADGWISPEQTAKYRGDFWGLTRTELVGDLRWDERVPNYQAPVWIKINRKARRYYLHRALVVIHTEGADRITRASGAADIRKKSASYFYIGQDTDYLRELRRVDPRGYRHLMTRIWPARALHPLFRLLPKADRGA